MRNTVSGRRDRVLLIYREPSRAQPYAAALSAVGVNPELVSANTPITMDNFSGLVLMGGSDLDPKLYGESPQPETDPPDAGRDQIELAVLREALELDLPVLAICRGLQLLNVFHGGSLIQHLHSTDRHRKITENRGQPAHEIAIEPDTLLSGIAGTTSWQVNSRHHQAVKTVGAGLRVSAFDPEDATVEAVEQPGKRFVLGVQWHPEDQVLQDLEQVKLFRSFAAAL
jgi:putative glutamine amidotransferase